MCDCERDTWTLMSIIKKMVGGDITYVYKWWCEKCRVEWFED